MSYEVILQMINVLFLSLLLFILPFLMKSLDININKPPYSAYNYPYFLELYFH